MITFIVLAIIFFCYYYHHDIVNTSVKKKHFTMVLTNIFGALVCSFLLTGLLSLSIQFVLEVNDNDAQNIHTEYRLYESFALNEVEDSRRENLYFKYGIKESLMGESGINLEYTVNTEMGAQKRSFYISENEDVYFNYDNNPRVEIYKKTINIGYPKILYYFIWIKEETWSALYSPYYKIFVPK